MEYTYLLFNTDTMNFEWKSDGRVGGVGGGGGGGGRGVGGDKKHLFC